MRTRENQQENEHSCGSGDAVHVHFLNSARIQQLRPDHPNGILLSAEEGMTRKSKSVPYRSHEEATVQSFRKDPRFAPEYLNSILEDGDQEELMLALRRMSQAVYRNSRNRQS